MLKQDLRIVFMGTPDYAKGSLEALVDNAFNIVGVFCQPDKPKGRGMKLMAPPVKEYAISKGIPVYQPVKLRNNEEVKEIFQCSHQCVRALFLSITEKTGQKRLALKKKC